MRGGRGDASEVTTYTAIVATLTLAIVIVIAIYGRSYLMDFETFRQAVDAETTRIAGKFEQLLAKANTPAGLSPAEQAEATATIARLKGIGADPADPIPAEPTTDTGSDAGSSTGGDANPGTTE